MISWSAPIFQRFDGTFFGGFFVAAIRGSGKISGTTGVTKSGDGALVITNTGGNNYAGKTVISGGSLNVTSLANGGSASAIGASSASPTNLVLAGGTLAYSGPTVTINRGYSLQGVNTNSGIDAESTHAVRALLSWGNLRAGDAVAPGDVQKFARWIWPGFLNVVR